MLKGLLVYPSNIFNETVDFNENACSVKGSINIMLGNSAHETNCHEEALIKLSKFNNENVKIYAPLSYGDQEYAQKIAKIGHDIFGDRFIPLMHFLKYKKYISILESIDIAVFPHKRQQAFGNIVQLVGLGKKVYVRNDINTWNFFKEIDVQLFDCENIDLKMIDKDTPQPTPSTIEYSKTIGLFEGAGYMAKGFYRPYRKCEMQTLMVGYCPVCQNAIQQMIDFYTK